MKYIIIGASQGIGNAVLKSLKNKNELIICTRNISSIKKNFSNENCVFLKFDANNSKDINKLFNLTKKNFGKIDGIICCQGVLGEPEDIFSYNIKNWFKIFDLNFRSNFLIIRKLFKLIKKNNYSNIIFFSGGGAFNSWEKFSPYSVAKTALVRFSENLAAESKKHKIIVNCVAPGFIRTNIHNKSMKKLSKLSKDYRSRLKKSSKIKPDFSNVVGLISFILKSKSMHLSGRTISANFDKWKSKIFLSSLKRNKDYLTLRRHNTKKEKNYI